MSVRFVIDSLDFVRNAGIHHDKIPVLELVRLHDFLFDRKGEIAYRISGQLDKNHNPGLYLEIKGKIHLICQRCLDKLTHTVDVRTFLLLVKTEVELNQIDEDDTLEAILATHDMDVLNLIEDEIILGLPISSRHPDGKCKLHKPDSIDNDLTDKTPSANPFSALAALKKTN